MQTQVPGRWGEGDGTFSIFQTPAQWSLGSFLYTVLTTTVGSGCCHYSYFSNEELRLRGSTDKNEGRETSQTFSSMPWVLGKNGAVSLLRGYLGAGRERARGHGGTAASGHFDKDQPGFKPGQLTSSQGR